MILKITRNTDAIWKKKFVDIDPASPNLKKILADMSETLTFTQGVGLAAPQVGYPWRLFIIDFGDLKETFINPKILSKVEETDRLEEGCLSVPGYRGEVIRSTELEIDYYNAEGKHKKAKLSGYYARIAQHEYDHLNSTFYVERIKNKKKLYHFDPVKIVFFGSSSFSATILKSLIGQIVVGEYDVQLVITSPEKRSGRGQKIQISPVAILAEEFNIDNTDPERIAKKEKGQFKLVNKPLLAKLKSLKPDLIVLASYGKILPKEFLAVTKNPPINVHPSLLPKHRGPAPIQTAILKGDKNTGVTIMAMNEKMDEGDIFLKARTEIKPNDTSESLSNRLADLATLLLHQVIHYVITGKIKTKPQDHTKATYTKFIDKKDGQINWQKPPKNLERMVRAYFPWPGVWTDYKGKNLKLLPNKKVQLEGKNPISLKDFQAGHKDFDLEW